LLTEIKLKRLRAGVSGKELAHRARIERTRLSRLETGHLCPRPDELARIEKVLAEGPQPPQRGKE